MTAASNVAVANGSAIASPFVYFARRAEGLVRAKASCASEGSIASTSTGRATTDAAMTLTVTFRVGTDPDKAIQLVQNRVQQAEPRLPAVVHYQEEFARHGRTPAVAEQPLRHDLSAQLRGAQTSRTAWRGSTASVMSSSMALATIRCAYGSIRKGRPNTA